MVPCVDSTLHRPRFDPYGPLGINEYVCCSLYEIERLWYYVQAYASCLVRYVSVLQS